MTGTELLNENRATQRMRDVQLGQVDRAGPDDLAGGHRVEDPIEPEAAQRPAQPAPTHQVPVLRPAEVAQRLDLAFGRLTVPVGVLHPQHPVRVRIGLHAGEPVREGNDFYGKSVILASRVAGEASGGEILASALLRELTESAGDIRFEAARTVTLKGLVGTHQVSPVCLA